MAAPPEQQLGIRQVLSGREARIRLESATRLRNFDQRLFFQCLEADSVPLNSSNLESPNQITRQDSGNNISDLKAQLEELRDLVEEGLITEDDYTRKKAELIEELD